MERVEEAREEDTQDGEVKYGEKVLCWKAEEAEEAQEAEEEGEVGEEVALEAALGAAVAGKGRDRVDLSDRR